MGDVEAQPEAVILAKDDLVKGVAYGADDGGS